MGPLAAEEAGRSRLHIFTGLCVLTGLYTVSLLVIRAWLLYRAAFAPSS